MSREPQVVPKRPLPESGVPTRPTASEILDYLDFGLMIVDRQGAVFYRNRAAARLNLHGENVDEALASIRTLEFQENWTDVVRSAVSNGHSKSFFGSLLAKGARPVRVRIVGIPLPPSKATLALIRVDACESDHHADPWESSQRLAALGRLAAHVAHELNNPLDGILRYLNLALRLVDVASESALKTYLTESRDGLNRMAQIIGELLSFSRFTDGEMDERSVNAVVEEAVRTLAAALDAHRIAVAVDFQHQEMPMVRGSRLYQVCCNLIKNAIDAMPNGGRLCITTGLVQDHVILRVADTGIGLPKEVDRLFEAFYTTKPAGKGTGLGLAICKTYVENMKGTLQAEPGREQGAVFTVRIPLRSFHRPRSESAGMVLDLTARPGASPPRATAKSEGRPSNDD